MAENFDAERGNPRLIKPGGEIDRRPPLVAKSARDNECPYFLSQIIAGAYVGKICFAKNTSPCVWEIVLLTGERFVSVGAGLAVNIICEAAELPRLLESHQDIVKENLNNPNRNDLPRLR